MWTLIAEAEPDADAWVELCIDPGIPDRYVGPYANRNDQFRWRFWRLLP